MHELITMMENMFSDTILGSDINRVKHLFYFLKVNQTEFIFFHDENIYDVLVEEVGETTVVLYAENFSPGAMRGKIQFEVINELYTFEVVLTSSSNSNVEIIIPAELQSVQYRTSKRFNCDDLFMNFIILYRTITGGNRKVGSYFYSEARFNHLIREIRKDNLDLNLINIITVDYIQKVSKDYEIRIFHQDEMTGSQRHIYSVLSKEKKTIYVENCTLLDCYIGESDYPELLTNYKNYYSDMQEQEGIVEAMDFLAAMQSSERRNFFVSYIISPIVLYDDVIGYIKVYTTAMEKYQLVTNQALYIHELSEIVSYAFTKISIRQQKFDSMNVTTKIVDISLTGLLFSMEDRKMYEYLKRHNIIKMLIPVNDRVIEIRGEIRRFIERSDHFLLGVRYFTTKPDDILVLENYIYEKSFMLISE